MLVNTPNEDRAESFGILEAESFAGDSFRLKKRSQLFIRHAQRNASGH
jgi:hypothetical protein